jgi:hypothetical protein
MAPPVELANPDVGHKVILSLGVLVAAAFVFQGVADSSAEAHTVILALLVGVVLILMMNAPGTFAGLAQYPWLPPGG